MMRPTTRRSIVAALATALALGATAVAAADPGAGATVSERADRIDNVVEFPNDRFVPPRRAVMVADSVLAGVEVYGAADRLTGAWWHLDAGVCRRLITTSCKAAGSPRPPTLVQELSLLPFAVDEYDLFIVATGYNDSASILSTHWDDIVGAIRGAGFEHIAWLDYRTAMGGSVGRNSANLNAVLSQRAATDPHVTVWSFDAHTLGRPWFVADRIHLNPTGAAAVADWLSQMVTTIDVD